MTARDFDRPGIIYTVVDARDPDRVRYVGRTIQPLKIRVRSHWYEAMRKNSKFQNWLRSRNDRRQEVIFTEIASYSDGRALNIAEIDAIAHYRSMGQADMNLTAGGDGRLGYTLTPEQAEAHRNRVPRGEGQWQSKFTWDQVREIRSLREKSYIPDVELARRYGVSRSSIGSVLKNDLWYDPEYDPSALSPIERSGDSARNRKITSEDVIRMRKERSEIYETNEETGLRYGISGDMTYRILKNLNWYDPDFDPETILRRTSS